jgi:uncharacterized protein YciI
MSLYAVSCIDRPDSLAVRMAAREAHLAYVRGDAPARLIVGGPYLSPEGAMIGSLLIVEAENEAAIAAFVREDPYGKAGLFQSVEVRPWKVTVGSLGNPAT